MKECHGAWSSGIAVRHCIGKAMLGLQLSIVKASKEV